MLENMKTAELCANRTTLVTFLLVVIFFAAGVYAVEKETHWAFDRGYGTTAYEPLNGVVGSIYGASWTDDGVIDGALSFDGVNDYVEAERTFGFTFSISLWIKTDSPGPAGTLWWQGAGLVDADLGGAHNDFGTSLVGDKFCFGVGLWALWPWNYDQSIMSTTNVTDNKWHHLVAARNHETGLIAIYVDGEFEASGLSYTGDKGASPNIRIGSFANGATDPIYFFGGLIDDVRVYTRYLTEAEIKVLAAPKVTTVSADNISYFSATLHGNLDTIGAYDSSGVDVYFEYGTSWGSYPHKTSALRMNERGAFEATMNNLSNDTTYYYRAVVAGGTTPYGEAKTFKTVSGKARTPVPGDGATSVIIEPALTWTAGEGAMSHDVYFGTENPPVELVKDDIGELTYSPGVLDYQTVYYWRVVENSPAGEIPGDVWEFRTGVVQSWVDDDYYEGGVNDGHTWGLDAFDTVQAGINAANYSGQVTVAGGVYLETITLRNGVALIGETAETTIIDAEGNGSVVTAIDCDETTIISGFTLTNGKGANGGGICSTNSDPGVYECVISDNTTTDGARGANGTWTQPSGTGGDGGDGGGMYNDNGIPLIVNCIFSGNSTGKGGDGGNGAPPGSNGRDPSDGGDAGDGGDGGAICNLNSTATIINCTFANNTTGVGGSGGIRGSDTTSDGDDGTDGTGGAIHNENGSQMITNTILYGDMAGGIANEIYNLAGVTEISYSNIAGSNGSGGEWDGSLGTDSGGNIDTDPLFAGQNDYHLQSEAGRYNAEPVGPIWIKDAETSPCIDAGDPASDFEGELSGNGSRINMGAYGGTKHASKTDSLDGDLNSSGVVDFEDFAIMAADWKSSGNRIEGDADGNGTVDLGDLRILAFNWLDII